MPQTTNESHELTHSGTAFKRLDRQDWYRWACVLCITLIEVAGLWFVTKPGIKASIFEQDAVERAVIGLLGLVLLFAVFAVYQQVLITRLRHRLAAQIGMTATLEMLRPPEQAEVRLVDGRKIQRYHFDQRLKINATLGERETTLNGWTADISDGGVGAVIPERLPLGTRATVRFRTAQEGPELEIEAIVRHQRGFHHGLEFVRLTSDQLQRIRAAYAGAVPFQNLYQ